MRPVLGDFLAAASEHIDAASCWEEPLPPAAARAAISELARLLTTMSRCASAFILRDEPRPPYALELAARADWDARTGLRRAAVRMRVAASVLGDHQSDRTYDHPVVARLTQAADCLAAGHDLLQTHFSAGPFGSRHGNSRWAPVITSAQLSHALLTEMAGHAHRIAPWAIRLIMTRPADEALPPQARVAVSTACQRLRAAEAAAWAAIHLHGTAGTHPLLYAIPVNTAPPRHRPGIEETVPSLCQGTITTAERLHYLSRSFASRPYQPGTGTAASWQHIAQGAAITGHCTELILRSLAEAASQLTARPDTVTALARAADAAKRAWTGWRAVAHTWDTFTTAISKRLTPTAAETDDIVLWVGRLAHRDPAWIPARGHAGLLRDPADLGAGRESIANVVTALHHAAEALANIATCEREAVRSAAAGHELYVPTRLLPEDHDVPYRYAPAPTPTIDALLDTYDDATDASHAAATALGTLASATHSSQAAPSLLDAASQPMPFLPGGDTVPAWVKARQPRPGQVENALRDLGISEPAFLARASDIDDAAKHLLREATVKTRRRPAHTDLQLRHGTLPASETRHRPARTAAKDTPRSTDPAMPLPSGQVPAAGTPNLPRTVKQPHTPRKP